MTGAELQEARELAGLTQEQLAQRLGVHRTTVAAWEGKAIVKPSKSRRYLAALQDVANVKAA